MADCLLVPIHVEALLLSEDRAVTEASEDFTRLPYCNGQRDVNSHIGYISEEIVSQPFQNQNLYLRAGLHLHWFLPPALTRGEEKEEENKTIFPRVPDRWLISRAGGSKPPRQWIVESDYLHPETEGEGSIVFPLALKEPAVPYRRLGRNMEIDQWQPANPAGIYLNQSNGIGLTAIGYGLPTFAAFYPNCYSVFGFYDEEFKDSFPADLKYSVIGWYSNPADDFLKKYLDQLVPPADVNIPDVLEKDLGWHLLNLSNGAIPKRMFCYGAVSKPLQDFKPGTEKVAVASGGLEALSAYLADKIAAGQTDQKALIEDQLEFLCIQSRLLNNRLDLDAKFLESQHERTFNAVFGGSQWTLQPDSPPAGVPRKETTVKLSLEIGRQLSDLNQRQREYDRTMQEITDMQRQLFSDWYKYMLCVYPPQGADDDYPDIDYVRHFIETQDLGPLARRINDLDALKKNELDPKLEALSQAIAQHNKQEGAESYLLKPIAASRYWQPKEPVVLIVDEGDPAFLENRIAHLDCPIVDGIGSVEVVTRDILSKILDAIKIIDPGSSGLPDAEKQQPWPIFLEWEVEFFPMSEGGNVFPTRNYQKDFITRNFALQDNDVELQKNPDKSTVPSAQIYSGYSILTLQAGIQLKQEIAKFLHVLNDPEKLKGLFSKAVNETQFEAWYQSKPKYTPVSMEDEVFQKWLSENIDQIYAWYERYSNTSDGKTVQSEQRDPVETFLSAFNAMRSRVFLSQVLSGFNDALLMHKQTLQLPIDDPLGFTEYQDFATRVAGEIAGENKSAPQPLDEFNPIRAGTMKILHLRLVDTFGRVKELPSNAVITNEQMRNAAENQDFVWLPTRLVQPARLNFRWLAAGPVLQADDEMNVHPSAQPICGWLLPNLLDNSLMVYDQSGTVLGSLTANTASPWQRAPGSHIATVNDIPNPHLKKIVEHISTAGNISDFITMLDKSLTNIAPSHPDGDLGLALLIGRPVAVVRASLKLELLGRPAVHQGWYVFRRDLGRNTRDSNAFDAVSFPVRLGEQQQLNDGLICYWMEDQQGNISQPGTNPPVELSLNDPPRIFTMLLDPHGTVHATSGILPVKAIDIPPDQYSHVLRHLAVTFLAAPILTDKDRINLPLPVEPGYGWTWLEGWESLGTGSKINPPNSQETFAARQEIREGWLKLSPDEKPADNSRQDKE